MECKNKRFYKQAHVWPEREPPAVHSSGVETKAATLQTKQKVGAIMRLLRLAAIGRSPRAHRAALSGLFNSGFSPGEAEQSGKKRTLGDVADWR